MEKNIFTLKIPKIQQQKNPCNFHQENLTILEEKLMIFDVLKKIKSDFCFF
jgi:hypothetical protein